MVERMIKFNACICGISSQGAFLVNKTAVALWHMGAAATEPLNIINSFTGHSASDFG